MTRCVTLALFMGMGLSAVGCGGHGPAAALARPPELELEGQSKCGVQKSQDRPLIVEWPSTDRGDLEAHARESLVAVRYVGCDMEVLRRCRVPGDYRYTPFTRKEDRISIRDADELYANVPLGAVKLEGKLAKSGQLNVLMTVVGKYQSERSDFRPSDLHGDCARATHVVSGVTVGAFEFFAGADAEVGGGVSFQQVGAGARNTAARELLNRDGDPAACSAATLRDEEPPDGCGAFLRLEVVPVVRERPAAPEAATRKGAPAKVSPAPATGDERAPAPKPLARGKSPAPRHVLARPVVALARAGDRIVVVANQGGELALAEKKGGGGWSTWRTLERDAPALPPVAANHDGRMEIAITKGGAAFVSAEKLAGGGWSTWAPLPSPGGTLAGRPALQQTTRGFLGVFARDASGALQHAWQTKPGASWSRWLSLGGDMASDPVAALADDGRLVVAARSTSGDLVRLEQERSYGPWGNWSTVAEGVAGTPAIAGGSAMAARTTSGDLLLLRFEGHSARRHKLAGPRVAIDPRLARLSSGEVVVSWRTQRGAPGVALFDSSGSRWLASQPALASDVELASTHHGKVDALAIGRDGKLWHAEVTRQGLSWSVIGALP
jgi:hypothetical protein